MGNCCGSKRAEENKKYSQMEERKVEPSETSTDAGESSQQKELQQKCEDYLEKNFPTPASPNEILDEDGKMKFEYFIKVYRTALAWNKALFEEKKQNYVKQRRDLMKNNDDASRLKYKQICVKM